MIHASITQHTQKGVGLIEVLVSLLILAVSVLGFVALQANSMEVSGESFERTQSLALMRDIGEKIRANPEGLDTYREGLTTNGKPNTSNPAPTKQCGLLNSASTAANPAGALCNPKELAAAETYLFKKELLQSGFTLNMLPCPGTGRGKKTNIMYSYCLIAAWGDTNPTIGTDTTTEDDGVMDCLTPASGTSAGGSYHPGATCMLMELT